MSSLITVAYPDGNVIAVRVRDLTDEDRAVLAAVTASVFPEGLTQVQAAALLLFAVELHRDEAAYRRVCEQRGLLPL